MTTDTDARQRAREVLALPCGFGGPIVNDVAHVSVRAAIDAMLAFASQASEQQGEGMVLVPREIVETMALFADEWDRWQTKGSTSTERMVQLNYGKARIGLPQFRKARELLAAAPPIPDVQAGGERAPFWMIEHNDGGKWLTVAETGQFSANVADCLRFPNRDQADHCRTNLPHSIWLKCRTGVTEHQWIERVRP